MVRFEQLYIEVTKYYIIHYVDAKIITLIKQYFKYNMIIIYFISKI